MHRVMMHMSTDELVEGVRRALEQLDEVNAKLREYGIDFPLGAQGVIDMRSQLEGQLEELRPENDSLRVDNESLKARVKELEDIIVGAATALTEHNIGDIAFDALQIHAAGIEAARQ